MRGKHHLPRRPGSIQRLWLRRHYRARAVRQPKPARIKPRGRDGLVVSGAMAATLTAVGVAAVLTPGGARLAPILAEPVPPAIEPAPEAAPLVFTPPAEYEFPIAVEETPIPTPTPTVRWVVEKEEMHVPPIEVVEREPRGRHWAPDVDHSDDRRDSRHDAWRTDRPRPTPYPRDRDERDHGERGGRERNGSGHDGHGGQGGHDRGERGDSGGRKGSDGGKSHDRGGSDHGGKGRGR